MFEQLTKREFGSELESFARGILEKAGCKIIELNYSSKLGEIDIIARDSSTLIFIEVRYRKNSGFGGSLASVDKHKQAKLIKTAHLYLQQHKLTNKVACRFDVFAIEGNLQRMQYNWVKDAFRAN